MTSMRYLGICNILEIGIQIPNNIIGTFCSVGAVIC